MRSYGRRNETEYIIIIRSSGVFFTAARLKIITQFSSHHVTRRSKITKHVNPERAL